MRQRLENAPELIWVAAVLIAWLVFVGGSIALCGAGFLHPESYSFLPHFLSGAPLLELIYGNRVTDWGHYQARELGFVFDYLDCQFIDACWRRGHPHFFSISHYGLLFVAGLALWRIGTRYLGLSRPVSFGFVLLIWSGPSAVLYTSFYRCAKVGLFAATLMAAWAWFAARGNGSRSIWRVGLFGIAALMLPMFDKQGLIFLCGLVLFTARNAIVHRTPRNSQIAKAAAAALGMAWLYARFLGPAIVHRLNGYEIERDYATIPWKTFLADPIALVRIAGNAVILAVDSFRIPLGNLPLGIALLAGWWIVRQARRADLQPLSGWQRALESRWLFLWLAALVLATYAAMLTLFPLMASSEHRRFFYCLPVTALWVLATATALAQARRDPTVRERWLEMAIGALVLSNLFALQEHRFVLRHGHYREFRENAAHLQVALHPDKIAKSGISAADAAEFLETAPLFPDAVPPSLQQDRIFLFLTSRSEALQPK